MCLSNGSKSFSSIFIKSIFPFLFIKYWISPMFFLARFSCLLFNITAYFANNWSCDNIRNVLSLLNCVIKLNILCLLLSSNDDAGSSNIIICFLVDNKNNSKHIKFFSPCDKHLKLFPSNLSLLCTNWIDAVFEFVLYDNFLKL